MRRGRMIGRMEPLRLDPADPLASVLRWLAALAQALGLDPSALFPRVQLDRAGAAAVRRWLADWSRQLRVLIRTDAARLARTLAKGLRSRPCAAQAPVRTASHRPRSACGRMVALAHPARRVPRIGVVGPAATRRDPAELLTEAEDAALRLRTRAVLSALRDRGTLVARLARRLARAKLRCERPRSHLRRVVSAPRHPRP